MKKISLKPLFALWFAVVSITANFDFFHPHSFTISTENQPQIINNAKITYITQHNCLIEQFLGALRNAIYQNFQTITIPIITEISFISIHKFPANPKILFYSVRSPPLNSSI